MQWDLMGAAQKWPYIRRDLRHVDHISDHHSIVATLFPEISWSLLKSVRNSNLGLWFFPFKCCVSHLSVDRFGKNFEGVMTLGQVKSSPNFCSFAPQRAEKRNIWRRKNTNLNLNSGLCSSPFCDPKDYFSTSSQAQNSKPNFHWSLIVGEFRVGRDFLRSKPDASPWIAAKAADSVLRGVAQVWILPPKKWGIGGLFNEIFKIFRSLFKNSNRYLIKCFSGSC